MTPALRQPVPVPRHLYIFRFESPEILEGAVEEKGGNYRRALTSIAEGSQGVIGFLNRAYVQSPFFGVRRGKVNNLIRRARDRTCASKPWGTGRVLIGLAVAITDDELSLIGGAGFQLEEELTVRVAPPLEHPISLMALGVRTALAERPSRRISSDERDSVVRALGLEGLRFQQARGKLVSQGRFALVDVGLDLDHRAFEKMAFFEKPVGLKVGLPDTVHGTAALSVVAGRWNGRVKGLAPWVDSVGFSSIHRYLDYRGERIQLEHVAAAILHAAAWLEAGDVLLVERETSEATFVESNRLIREAIRLATDSGIIVVEPAGNDDIDLGDGEPISGAIVVGSASKEGELWKTNDAYGSRVDCFAPEVRFSTAWYSDQAVHSHVDTVFENTSLTSALIAGAVVNLQRFHRESFGFQASSEEMRGYLRGCSCDRADPLRTANKPVGWLPDCAKIVERMFQKNRDAASLMPCGCHLPANRSPAESSCAQLAPRL